MHQVTQHSAKWLKTYTNSNSLPDGWWMRTSYRMLSLQFTYGSTDSLYHRCLGHVVNLANVDVMDHITKIVVVEMATTIWEYGLSLPDNCVLNGSLDVIAAICMLAIKVCHLFLFTFSQNLTCWCRFSLLGSTLRHLKHFSSNADLLPPSLSLFIAM